MGYQGTGGEQLKSNKPQFPNAVLVADEAGAGLRQWQLEKGELRRHRDGRGGHCAFFKQGAMSAAEIDNTLKMIRQYIDQSAGGATGSP